MGRGRDRINHDLYQSPLMLCASSTDCQHARTVPACVAPSGAAPVVPRTDPRTRRRGCSSTADVAALGHDSGTVRMLAKETRRVGALDEAPIVGAEDRDAWRRWLEANHASSSGAWLVMWRRASGRQGIEYE